jgi:hypothetical protein
MFLLRALRTSNIKKEAKQTLNSLDNAISSQKTAHASGHKRLLTRSIGVFSVFCICLSLVLFFGPFSGSSEVSVTVNAGKVVGTNNLSLGFQLNSDWKTSWIDRSILRELAQNVGFRLVRIFDYTSSTLHLNPCISWNETAKTGTWDNSSWATIDSLTEKIFEIGAEPMFCLGQLAQNMSQCIPKGMAINSGTNLPYPDSWAAYCREWPKHFKSTGAPVRFYETINEPWMYFYPPAGIDYTKLDYFKNIFNAAARAMRQENHNVFLGFDGSNRRGVLDYWLENGGEALDFISFHKYDSGTIEQYSSEELLYRAETSQLTTSLYFYGIQDAREKYYDARGKWILVFNSESNLDSASETGTDPRIQQMVGAVWLALVLKTGILNGLDYSVYFDFGASARTEYETRASGGIGFGMVNLDDNLPWYPYYVQEMIGSNLAVGDQIVESTSSSPDFRSVAWIHNGKLNTLVICKNNATGASSLKLNGVQGTLNYSKIDNSISWDNESGRTMQKGTMNSTGVLTIKGYTVALFQSLVPTMGLEDSFESGGFNKWTGTLITSGETATVSATKPYNSSYGARFTTKRAKECDGITVRRKC